MEKFSTLLWDCYKKANEAKIEEFRRLATNEATCEECLDLAIRNNPIYFQNMTRKQKDKWLEIMEDINETIIDMIERCGKPQSKEDCLLFYKAINVILVNQEGDTIENAYNTIPQNGFKALLGLNLVISTLLYTFFPNDFLPNFYVMQFMHLNNLAEKYDIELPPIPNRNDYKARNEYYLQFNDKIISFLNNNGVTDPAEMAFFLYGYELPLSMEQLVQEKNKEMPETPNQAWLLVGKCNEGEEEMENGFWQANPFTERGDIMVFYEKSPVMAVRSIWRATKNGVVDPFFQYYSATFIGQKISIPENMVLTNEDFKANEYFQHKGEVYQTNADGSPKLDKNGKQIVTHIGNYVTKNFQDCSGWEVTRQDYSEILRMFEQKGYDTSALPKLYQPKKIGRVSNIL